MTYAEVEKEIDRAEQEWMDAVKRQDAAALDRLIADDFLIASDSLARKLGDKKLYVEDLLASGAVKDGSASFERIKLRVYGNTGIVNSIFKFQVTIAGKEYSGEFLTTAVWVKNGEQWQYVTSHSHRLSDSGNLENR
jgi:ketosteroid isomerase-like protein